MALFWELPVLWEADEESENLLAEAGIANPEAEKEVYEGTIAVRLDEILAFHDSPDSYNRDTTMLRVNNGNCWEINLPYLDFKKQLVELLKNNEEAEA